MSYVNHQVIVRGPRKAVRAFYDRHIAPGMGSRSMFDTIIPSPQYKADATAPTPLTHKLVWWAAGKPQEHPEYELDSERTQTFGRSSRGISPVKIVYSCPKKRHQALLWLETQHPALVDEAMRAWAFIERTGCMDWSEWNDKNWGCRWDGEIPRSIPEPTGTVLQFTLYTAPSTPTPIWHKLAELWPQLTITCAGKEEHGAFTVDVLCEKGVATITEKYCEIIHEDVNTDT